jgi:hypothetical protein
MDKIVGFAHIKKDATTCAGAINPEEFKGVTCAVMEFGVDDCVLVLNPQGTALASFDKEDVQRSFKCGYFGKVITPPNLSPLEQITYVTKVENRKGGYNNLLRGMVIAASMSKGEFCDSFLWAKQ